MKKILAVMMASVALMSGCATVVDGTSQPVTFKSNPEGVKVYYVNGDLLGVTPFTAQLDRDGDTTFVAKKDGFASRTVEVGYKKNNTTHANALSPQTFVVGDMVDTLSGAQFELDPVINFTMTQAK